MSEKKTEMDSLNEYLIKVSNMNKVGIRRKIVEIRKFLNELNKKNPEPELTGRKLLCEIDNPPEHIKKLIDYLIEEVASAGGDGDCHVYCKGYDAGNLAAILWKELENRGHQQWWEYVENTDGVNIHDSQADFRFTNNLEEVNPNWSQCTITI